MVRGDQNSIHTFGLIFKQALSLSLLSFSPSLSFSLSLSLGCPRKSGRSLHGGTHGLQNPSLRIRVKHPSRVKHSGESSIRVKHPSQASESSQALGRVKNPSQASESRIRVEHPSQASESSQAFERVKHPSQGYWARGPRRCRPRFRAITPPEEGAAAAAAAPRRRLFCGPPRARRARIIVSESCIRVLSESFPSHFGVLHPGRARWPLPGRGGDPRPVQVSRAPSELFPAVSGP